MDSTEVGCTRAFALPQIWYAQGAMRLALRPQLVHAITDIISTAAEFGHDTLTLARWSVVANAGPKVAKTVVTVLSHSLRSRIGDGPTFGHAMTSARSGKKAMGGAMFAPKISRTESVTSRGGGGGMCMGGTVVVEYGSPSLGFLVTRMVLALPIPVLAQLTKSTDKCTPLPSEATPFVVDVLDRAARDRAVPMRARGDAIGALGALLTGQTTWIVVDGADEPLRLDVVARLFRLCALPAGDGPLAKLAKAMLSVAFEMAEVDKVFSSGALQRVTGLTSPAAVAAIPPDDRFYDDGSDRDGGGVGDGEHDAGTSTGSGRDSVVRCTVRGVNMDTSSNASVTTALVALPVEQQVSADISMCGSRWLVCRGVCKP